MKIINKLIHSAFRGENIKKIIGYLKELFQENVLKISMK
jgi:hypothetical protein